MAVDSIATIASQLGVSEAAMSTIILLVALWQIPWKGVAMWKAARNKHLVWFIVFLVVNLLAIPEILYIFIFSKTKKVVVKKKAKRR